MDSAISWLDRRGVLASFIWGVAEAVFFFIVPDVVVGAAALVAPKRWWRLAAAAIVGSLVGGVLLYAIASAVGAPMRSFIDGIPGVPTSMISEVQSGLTDSGGAAMVAAPFSGIPYKVYVVEMALGLGDLVSLLLWTIPARMVRIAPVAAIAGLVGHWAPQRLPLGRPALLAAYAVLWSAIYLAYYTAVGF